NSRNRNFVHRKDHGRIEAGIECGQAAGCGDSWQSPRQSSGAGCLGSSLPVGGFSAGGGGRRRGPGPLAGPIYTRFLVPIEPVSSWCLISHSQYKLGGKALHNNSEDKEVSHTNLAESPKMRLVSTALVMMAIALMMLAMTFLITPSGP